MDNETKFEYTYSSKVNEEVEHIKKKYLPKDEDKLEQLRKLDRSAERPGMIVAITVGMIGILVFGTGMSLSLVWTETKLVLGIVVSLVGAVLMGAALPLNKIITKRQRAKIAPQIIALSEELLK